MATTQTTEPERPTALQPLVRASGALLDRLFAPHGPSAYFRWVTPGAGGSETGTGEAVERPKAATVPAAAASAPAPTTARAARPSTPTRTTRSPRPVAPVVADVPAAGEVDFRRSGLTAVAEGTLLETAESAGLTPRYRCRRGICGTCTTPKLHGTVVDARTGETSDATGPIRICVSVPQGDVALDL